MQRKQLLLTKLMIPPSQLPLIARPDLHRKFDLARQHRFTLVAAPAGYGKTTAVAQWVAACSLNVGWVSLDSDDNALPRFLRYLTNALNQHEAEKTALQLGVRAALCMLDLEEFLVALLNQIAVADTDRWIVLDNYQVISNQAIHRAVEFMLDHAPEQFHLILITHSTPPFGLAKYRARGELWEIRTDALRFKQHEMDALLQKLVTFPLSSHQRNTLAIFALLH